MGGRQVTKKEIKPGTYTLAQAFGAPGPRALPLQCSSWGRPCAELAG